MWVQFPPFAPFIKLPHHLFDEVISMKKKLKDLTIEEFCKIMKINPTLIDEHASDEIWFEEIEKDSYYVDGTFDLNKEVEVPVEEGRK